MEPLRDHGSFANMPEYDDIDAHHTDRWQHHAMNLVSTKPAHRRRHRRSRPGNLGNSDNNGHAKGRKNSGQHFNRSGGYEHSADLNHSLDLKPAKTVSSTTEAPSQRVQFILGHTDETGSNNASPAENFTRDVFCEMYELRVVGENTKDRIWKETARFVNTPP